MHCFHFIHNDLEIVASNNVKFAQFSKKKKEPTEKTAFGWGGVVYCSSSGLYWV